MTRPPSYSGHVLLLGPRGCGKSRIGAELADRLGRPFIDLDDLTLARFAEPDVTAVWAAQGEAAWREAEAAALASALDGAAGVLALGGGTPMISAARERVAVEQAAGKCRAVYLSVPVEVLVARLAADVGDRPSLTGAEVAAEVAEVLAAREPTYRAVADWVMDAAAPPEVVVESIVALFT